ncbi:uncharacterized protein VICG_00343 [Vittaforma corneae ATCC 50505]|uniref:Proliferating cell nuclear antigen PCNA N-terminal domain-containing protein n=1 Tax=Vittaforma corneae (strain ATCC 50505) TaxID=993615 RepID=L2GP45_VITCO|nr:uncharacterized protein VICG_00343 [Vittaforma corneae ATCC 50505]ELA42591.1 hypothetical protein VICG_00343 [Vittaforma corneae ATCC 50505]
MSSILKLENKPYFVSLLKIFSQKSQITMEIDQNVFKISSLDSPHIYLSFENSLYKIDVPIEFTIRVDELLKNIEILDSSLIILDTSFKIVSFTGCNDDFNNIAPIDKDLSVEGLNRIYFSFVEIPFVTPIKSHYVQKEIYSTKAIIDKECIKNFISGNVTYHCENNKLYIEKYTVEMNERLEVDAEFLVSGYLNFYCSNEWIGHALSFYELINTVMLCFSDGLMSIRFILKDYTSSYLEIQVRALE